MKRILDQCSRRNGHDGWVVMVKGQNTKVWHALTWTFSTTREETRQLFNSMPRNLFDKYKITKANLKVESIGI